MKRIAVGVGVLLGLILIVRAVVEPFVIDMGDPATYRHDWGGPSLAGVLAVHCGPGIVAAVLFGVALRRRRRARPTRPRPARAQPASPSGAGAAAADRVRRSQSRPTTGSTSGTYP